MNKKTSILLIIIIALVAGGAIWFFVGKEPVEKEPVLTNLQVTEYQDPAALRKVIDELEDRNLNQRLFLLAVNWQRIIVS